MSRYGEVRKVNYINCGVVVRMRNYQFLMCCGWVDEGGDVEAVAEPDLFTEGLTVYGDSNVCAFAVVTFWSHDLLLGISLFWARLESFCG